MANGNNEVMGISQRKSCAKVKYCPPFSNNSFYFHSNIKCIAHLCHASRKTLCMWQHVHIPFRDANMCLCVMVDHANLNMNLLDNLNLNCGRSTKPCVIRSSVLTL